MRLKILFSLSMLLAMGLGTQAQIVINEFQPDIDQVEIKNIGNMEVPIGSYFLCSWPVYTELSSMTIVSGDLNLGPGELVVLSGHSMGDADDELGLYIMPQYTNSNAMIDYVEWGSTGHQRSTVAQGAGIWTAGDFVPSIAAGQSLQWDGEGDASTDWFVADDTFGEENLGGCDAVGGTISTMDPTEICAGDGVADPINVTLEGNVGTNSAWVITDEAGEILDLPEGSPFDLEGAGEGVCLIWHLSFEDGLAGAQVGLNANDLEGCFSLSNSIAVTRTGVAGGTITTQDVTTVCADDGQDDLISATVADNEGSNSQWVITDEAGVILELPAMPPFNFEGAGAGVCLIWHLSYEDGLTGAEVGMNANDLEGCFALSNSIAVTRLTGDDCDCTANGGSISTQDDTAVCTGDGVANEIDVTVDGASGTNTGWIITDDAGVILELPGMPPFDFEGAGAGVCLIWHIAYDNDLTGLEVGMNANDLDGCFSLSNSITVDRTEVMSAVLTTQSQDNTFTVCSGDGEADLIDVTLTNGVGTNGTWVITDDAGEILELPAGPPFDFEDAGDGVCLIWYLHYEDGLAGAEVGMNANDLEGCYALSNPVTVNRNGIAGGTVATDGGATVVDVIVGDGLADEIDFASAENVGDNYVFIVTDDAGIILEVLAGNTADFEGADPGVCLVYGFAYYGDLEATVGESINDITSSEGCYMLSTNAVTINREPVSVAENGLQSLKAWPNPVTENLTIELPVEMRNAQLNIYGVQGQLIYSEVINDSGNYELDMTKFVPGIYQVLLTNDGLSYRLALLKQ